MKQPIRLFAGYDEREKIGFHTFLSSVIGRTNRFVQVTPLPEMGMGHGSNAFTVSRFLVPWLCGFKGHAIFLDGSDMLCLGDIAELEALHEPEFAVKVVQHPAYESLHARKYVGTDMECDQTNYRRKNWASAMLINCEHPAWACMTPAGIVRNKRIDLLQFRFLEDFEIGWLPPEWNVLIDEGQSRENAKILHWTAGIPAFSHYKNARCSNDWFVELAELKGE